MERLPDESIDVICIDPPYLYLKNQKIERPFDEQKFFSECRRLLTKTGFIVMFGRGESFYRWNTILADLKFTFKEEIIWNKSHCTSPLMNLSRVHETISIFCKGKAGINKSKIPYLEMKSNDIDSVIGDVKRLKSILKNTTSLDAVLKFLENNVQDFKSNKVAPKKSGIINGVFNQNNREVSVLNSISNGLNEKSIIRSDFETKDTFSKFSTTADVKSAGSGDRCVTVVNAIEFGMNEKSIIKEVRNHYKAVHPTQKPVRLLERLLALVIPESKPREEIVVADFFGGSMSCMVAVHNMGMKGIACEIDKEYFEAGRQRIEELINKQKLELF
ncbi:site-specific DNA-methyltransferase [Elizabethkingia anophelis]|nr:site-specific DNA-methyltransferase [Elizabethkingia anophelis]